MWDPEQIKENAKKDFEKTWSQTAEMLPSGTVIKLPAKGEPHPLEETRQMIRKAFLEQGFEETVNKTLMEDAHVYKQYGPEAPVILDRIYYLAGLQRPDIGLSPEKKKKITTIIPEFQDYDSLQKILREYREGKIEGDDFLEEMVKKLGITEEQASSLVTAVFSEFTDLKPVPSNMTLRSHMTGTWFLTLEQVLQKRFTPVALFSIGYRFRREQKEDAGHLRAHLGASAVIAHEEMSLDAGREITRKILEKVGFTDVSFERKKATSKYYAKGTEEEVFAKHNNKKVEIADIGMYSPIALSNYGINIPVFNFGMGVERMAMILSGQKDVRELVYSQALEPFELDDRTIASKIWIDKKPSTTEGELISKGVSKTIFDHGDSPAPARFKAYEREWKGHKVTVWVSEKEEGKKLCGPASLNEIIVYQGNVMALPPTGGFENDLVKEALSKGARTGVTFRNAIGDLAAWTAENMKESYTVIHFKNAKSGADVNIAVHPLVQKYVTSKKKKLSVKGPVFATIEIWREKI